MTEDDFIEGTLDRYYSAVPFELRLLIHDPGRRQTIPFRACWSSRQRSVQRMPGWRLSPHYLKTDHKASLIISKSVQS